MDTKIENTADVFKALGDQNRLKILKLIAAYGNRLCVGMIANKIGITQPAVSQHLKVLKNSGLVESSKEGFHMHYSVCEKSLEDFGIDTIGFLKSVGTDFDPENACELKDKTDKCNELAKEA
jgi:ArsR family transcriptional regulator, arsenate/arsenite/antimonite-responsive transcriptional repressor